MDDVDEWQEFEKARELRELQAIKARIETFASMIDEQAKYAVPDAGAFRMRRMAFILREIASGKPLEEIASKMTQGRTA